MCVAMNIKLAWLAAVIQLGEGYPHQLCFPGIYSRVFDWSQLLTGNWS